MVHPCRISKKNVKSLCVLPCNCSMTNITVVVLMISRTYHRHHTRQQRRSPWFIPTPYSTPPPPTTTPIPSSRSQIQRVRSLGAPSAPVGFPTIFSIDALWPFGRCYGHLSPFPDILYEPSRSHSVSPGKRVSATAGCRRHVVLLISRRSVIEQRVGGCGRPNTQSYVSRSSYTLRTNTSPRDH